MCSPRSLRPASGYPAVGMTPFGGLRTADVLACTPLSASTDPHPTSNPPLLPLTKIVPMAHLALDTCGNRLKQTSNWHVHSNLQRKTAKHILQIS